MIAFPPDFSFYIQIVSLLALFAALNELLFKPVLRVLDERAARTTGVRAQAESMNRASDAARDEHDRRLDEVRRALAAETDVARTATAAEEKAILASAQDEASSALAARRAALAQQAAAARQELAGEAQDIAGRMVDRVLGRNAA